MSLPRTRLLKRTTRNVDARLFLVATEGARTEPAYLAIRRAKALHVAPAEAWPSKPPATQVYRLVEGLRAAQER